jgi:hypothetical protein
MNNAYGYLGYDTQYKKGDRITAAMFAGLENILNN